MLIQIVTRIAWFGEKFRSISLVISVSKSDACLKFWREAAQFVTYARYLDIKKIKHAHKNLYELKGGVETGKHWFFLQTSTLAILHYKSQSLRI